MTTESGRDARSDMPRTQRSRRRPGDLALAIILLLAGLGILGLLVSRSVGVERWTQPPLWAAAVAWGAAGWLTPSLRPIISRWSPLLFFLVVISLLLSPTLIGLAFRTAMGTNAFLLAVAGYAGFLGGAYARAIYESGIRAWMRGRRLF